MTLTMVGTFSFNGHDIKAISNNCAINSFRCTGYAKFSLLFLKITFKFGLQTFSSALLLFIYIYTNLP